jgi:uncharacterized membrane protein
MKFSLGSLANLQQVITELSNGLNKLDINDNFISFETTITIGAGLETKVRNLLQVIPSKMIITYQTGNGLITASGTAWTDDYLYIKNNGLVSVTAKITFQK